MKVLVYFMAFYWDNHQGGSGKYFDSTILVEIDNEHKAVDVWQVIHNKVKDYLKIKRPFDQTYYTKNQGEYSIIKAEII